MTYRKNLTAAVVLLVFGWAVLLAQQPDLQQVAAGMAANGEALKNYAWQSRVSVDVDGENKKVDLYQVRYDMDGKLQKTRIGGEGDQKKVRGPIRRSAAKKKKKQAAEFAEEVKEQLQAYLAPDTWKKALSEAFVRKESGTIKLQAQNVVAQGDQIDLELVEATKQPMTMRIETQVDESPLNVEITFQQLPDGPNYPARQVIGTVFDKKKLVITTENFSYVEQ
jgi:hypothetical protein